MAIRQAEEAHITPYRKPFRPNIGTLIFGVMFIYIAVCVVMYFRTSHMSGYEVTVGSLTENNVYHGIAIRKEEVRYSTGAGYIFYFAPEGTHVGVSSMVDTIDSSGTLSETLNSGSSNLNLTDEDLDDFKSLVVTYKNRFQKQDFSTVYDFKDQLNNELTSLSNKAILESLNQMDLGKAGITRYNSGKAGDVVYYLDGFEEAKADEIKPEDLDEALYEKKILTSNSLVGNGDPVYKLVTSEDWSLVFEVENARAAQLVTDQYVLVKFLKDQFKTYGKVSLHGKGSTDDTTMVELSFTNSMVDYISDRYLDIELILDELEGLKIPNTAITSKEFYLIDSDYFVKGTGGADGVMRRTYTENGEASAEFIRTNIYSFKDGKNYVDQDVLNAGDVIIKPDSSETLTVSASATLVGVFNINKGYADFREVTILAQNDEYAIVKSDTTYGLSNYDYIALNADTVSDDQFVSEQR